MSVALSTQDRRDEALPLARLAGVHHTARPTWKLAETVRFYHDIMGLELCHAISARGWGPPDHPDFLHFFFKSGNDSTIAFFYYLKTDKPADALAFDHWLYRSVHTAWRVETREEMLAWRERFEKQGLEVLQVRHEIIESIYVTDPNGYMVEISWQVREMNAMDAVDASLTIEAAIAIETRSAQRVSTIDEIWREKALRVEEFLDSEEG